LASASRRLNNLSGFFNAWQFSQNPCGKKFKELLVVFPGFKI